MLLQQYYHALLAFAGAPLCGASRNIRFDPRKLDHEERPATSSHKQRVLELERRQDIQTTAATTSTPLPLPLPLPETQDAGLVTDTTTVVDTLIVSPSPLAPVTVTSISISTAAHSTLRPTTPSTLSTHTTSTTTSQPPTITTPSISLCDNGYYLCPAQYNGGCCKSGFSCAIDSCVPPAGAIGVQRTCDTNFHLCPESLDYGCCPNAFDCGVGGCLSRVTAPVTVTSATLGITYTITTMPLYTTIGKAADSNPTAKQPTISASPSPSTTANPLRLTAPLSGIVIGGIVAGCVIGVLVFVLVGVCTYRRLRNRGNNDPPGGVPTTNFFDPAAPPTRTPGSGSMNHYTQEQGYFPKQPTVPVLNYPLPEGVAEMAETPVSYSQSKNWWGSVGYMPPGGVTKQQRAAIYEVDGTVSKRSNRWSKT